jgi:hypothetical protein
MSEKKVLDDDQLKDLIANSFKNIRSTVEKDLIESVGNSLRWQLEEQYKTTISEFFNEEIAPTLKAQLVENKVAIMESIGESLVEKSKAIGDAITKKMLEEIVGGSYKAGKIFEAIF